MEIGAKIDHVRILPNPQINNREVGCDRGFLSAMIPPHNPGELCACGSTQRTSAGTRQEKVTLAAGVAFLRALRFALHVFAEPLKMYRCGEGVPVQVHDQQLALHNGDLDGVAQALSRETGLAPLARMAELETLDLTGTAVVHRHKRIVRTLVERGADTTRVMDHAQGGLAGEFE